MSTVYAPAEGPDEVALCDCCDTRPGTATLIVTGIETWVCDRCRGAEENDPRFTAGLLCDVFTVLEEHGYTRPAGDKTALADALCAVRALVRAFEGLTPI